MRFQPSTYQIISTLNGLGLKHEDQPNSKGWLSIQCPNPSHFEQVHDNCSINLNSGFISCFSCGYGKKGSPAKTIVNAVMDRLNFSYREAVQFIEQGLSCGVSNAQVIDPVKKVNKRKRALYNFSMLDINPDNFYYTKQRRFTEDFIKQFNIKHAVSNWFEDYLIIPIIDTEKGINEYEGRKLKEYETLCKFYEVNDVEYYKLKRNFEKLCEDHTIRLNRKDYKVYIDRTPSEDSILTYLLKPKTLYIPNSRCQETIWNIDNLNRDEALWACEGLGSVNRLWSNISKNVTSIFGVSITQQQIDYLKQFKQVIYIPDFDKAGFDSVKYLQTKLDNIFICDIKSEDTDDNYVEDIKKASLLKPAQYISKYHLKFIL